MTFNTKFNPTWTVYTPQGLEGDIVKIHVSYSVESDIDITYSVLHHYNHRVNKIKEKHLMTREEYEAFKGEPCLIT